MRSSMKKLLLSVIVLLASTICSPAHAFVGELGDFNFTGVYAEKNDLFGYALSPTTSYIGGPSATNSLGYAMQFTVDDPIFIGHILTDINSYTNYPDGEGIIYFDWVVYNWEGDLPSDELGRSSVNINYTSFDYVQYNDFSSSVMALQLNQGVYGLAYERDFNGGQSISYLSDMKYTSHTPELDSLLLLASGLLFVRRKDHSI